MKNFFGENFDKTRLVAFGFIVFSGLLVFLSRYPGFFRNFPLNPDESLMLASVITVDARGLIPWVSFDTTTIGPITIWFLTLISFFTGSLSYSGVHIVAAVLYSFIFMICFSISSISYGKKWLPITVAFSLIMSLSAWRADYLHFTSELVPAVLLALSFLLICFQIKTKLPVCFDKYFSLTVGFLCGLAIFSKLQALPISLCLGFSSFALSQRNGINELLSRGLLILLGFMLPAIGFGWWLYSEGHLHDAWVSYVFAGASYGTAQEFNKKMLVNIYQAILHGWGVFRPTFNTMMIFATIYFLLSIFQIKIFIKSVRMLLAMSAWFFASLFAMIMPAGRFEHHGVFLLAPAICLLIFFISNIAKMISEINSNIPQINKTMRQYGVAFLALFFFGFFSKNFVWNNRSWWKADSYEYPKDKLADVCDFIQKKCRQGDSIAIWGWAPEIFVLTGKPSATRHMICHFLIDDNAAREAHRKSFLSDLQSSPPAVIVDSMEPNFFLWAWEDNYKLNRADSFPELLKFLSENYQSVSLSGGKKEGESIIYLLNKKGAL